MVYGVWCIGWQIQIKSLIRVSETNLQSTGALRVHSISKTHFQNKTKAKRRSKYEFIQNEFEFHVLLSIFKYMNQRMPVASWNDFVSVNALCWNCGTREHWWRCNSGKGSLSYTIAFIRRIVNEFYMSTFFFKNTLMRYWYFFLASLFSI